MHLRGMTCLQEEKYFSRESDNQKSQEIESRVDYQTGAYGEHNLFSLDYFSNLLKVVNRKQSINGNIRICNPRKSY